MKIITDKPFGMKDFNFICMGIVQDSGKDYACLLRLKPFTLYINEIHWTTGKNIHMAEFNMIDNDKEDRAITKFITSSTTIFSPKKINDIRKKPELYFYSSEYRLTESYLKRKEKGIL